MTLRINPWHLISTLTFATVLSLASWSCTPSRPAIDSAFEGAIERENTNALSALFRSSYSANYTITDKRRPQAWNPLLHVAIENGGLSSIEYLLSRGANPNATNWLGRSGLGQLLVCRDRFPSQERFKHAFQTLLNAGADINQRQSSGVTPLELAACIADLAAVHELLQRGAIVNSKNAGGATPLHSAGNQEVAEVLIQAGADLTARDILGRTAHDTALQEGRTAVASVILRAATKEGERGTPSNLGGRQ